ALGDEKGSRFVDELDGRNQRILPHQVVTKTDVGIIQMNDVNRTTLVKGAVLDGYLTAARYCQAQGVLVVGPQLLDVTMGKLELPRPGMLGLDAMIVAGQDAAFLRRSPYFEYSIAR